jgi:hypothetical protein
MSDLELTVWQLGTAQWQHHWLLCESDDCSRVDSLATGHCRVGVIIGCCDRVMSDLEWTVQQLGTAEWASSLVAVTE